MSQRAIVISDNEFLVDNRGNKGLVQVDGEIVLVYTNKTISISKCDGGVTENVPVFGFPGDRAWEKASKKSSVIDLESRHDLSVLFNKVCEGHFGRFVQ